jgi:hypothetical protein
MPAHQEDEVMAAHVWFGAERRLAAARPPLGEVQETLAAALDGFPFPIGSPLAPVVLPARSYRELFWSSGQLLDLLRRAAMAAAPDRAGRLAALGLDEEALPLFTPHDEWEERYCACMTRPDVAIGADGPRFLELNVSGAIGGVVETHVLNHAWLRIYGGTSAPFVADDPYGARAAMFHAVCRDLDLEPAVALVGSLRELPEGTTPHYYSIEADRLRERGLRAEFFEPEDLCDGLGLPGEPRYRTGLRNFAVPDWRHHGISLEPVRRALDAGCLLLSPQTSYLVANKKVMAWVSEGRPWMSDEDRRLADRYLPWTRVVADGPAEWQGGRHDLLELLAARRECFVLKKAAGMQGEGMLIGAHGSAAEWEAALGAAAVAGDTIAQEYVEFGRCELDVVAEDGRTPTTWTMAPVLSPYLFGGRPAGCMVRYLPTGETGITSVRAYGAIVNVAVCER